MMPVWTLLLVGAGLMLCLTLFVLLKVELCGLARGTEKSRKLTEAALGEIRQAIEELRVGLREAEQRTGVLVPPTPPRTGLNMTTRAQALRMFRRGEQPERIAAALHVPENEVRLLIKVHQLSVGR